jgi:hypothetical protein
MGNLTSTTIFNSEVYEQINMKIPESVNSFIQRLNEGGDNFEQEKLEQHCRIFIHNLIHGDRTFAILNDIYIGGLSAGLTSYLLSFKLIDSNNGFIFDIKYKDDVVNYIRRLIDVINKQRI